MAIIALPVTTRFAKQIDWTPDVVAQVNTSAYGGDDTVVANPWHTRWSAKVEMLPVIGEAAALPWQAVFAQLSNPANTFRLPVTEGLQTSLPAAAAATLAAAAGATQMVINGVGGVAISGLLAGHKVTVNDQWLMLTAAGAPYIPTGSTLITFDRPLHAAVAAGAAVELRNPTCLMALNQGVGWSVTPGKLYGGMSFTARERFA